MVFLWPVSHDTCSPTPSPFSRLVCCPSDVGVLGADCSPVAGCYCVLQSHYLPTEVVKISNVSAQSMLEGATLAWSNVICNHRGRVSSLRNRPPTHSLPSSSLLAIRFRRHTSIHSRIFIKGKTSYHGNAGKSCARPSRVAFPTNGHIQPPQLYQTHRVLSGPWLSSTQAITNNTCSRAL